MATLTVYGDTSDGVCTFYGKSYSTVRNSIATSVNKTATNVAFTGQEYSSENFYIYMGCSCYNTSSLPDDAVITAASEYLYVSANYTNNEFYDEVRIYGWGPTLDIYSSVPGSLLTYLPSASSFDTSTISSSYTGYIQYSFSSNALGAINPFGYTYLIHSSSRTRSGTSPSSAEYLQMYTADQAGTTYDPYLSITYDTGASYSTIGGYTTYVVGTSLASTTTASANLSGFSAGDFAIAFISRNSADVPGTVPSGWTLLGICRYSKETKTYGYYVFGKILGSGDLTTVSWSFPSSTKTLCQVVSYSGCNSSLPIFTAARGVLATESGTGVDCGSLVTTTPWVVALGSVYNTSSTTFTTPSPLTERRDYGHTNPDFWQVFADTNGSYSGGTLAPDFTASINSTYRMGFLIALRPQTQTIRVPVFLYHLRQQCIS